MLYAKIGVTFVYNFALRKFDLDSPDKKGVVIWQWVATFKESVPPPLPTTTTTTGKESLQVSNF